MISLFISRLKARITNPHIGRYGFVLLLTVLLTGSSGLVTASEPTIIVSSFQSQPEVLMPGGSAMITVTISNTAQKASITTTGGEKNSGNSVTTTNDINAYISDVFLFGNGLEVESGDYRRVGELGPGQSMPLTFMVRAPDKTGIYFPDLHIATEGGRSLLYPIPVNVNDDRLIQKNPAILIEKELPLSVEPGENAFGKLILKNTGDTSASEIYVNISPKDPDISIRSSQTSHISKLGPGDQAPIDLDIVTSENGPEGIHSLIMHITYSSNAGKIHQQDEIIPITYTGKSKLAIASVTSDPVRIAEGTSFSLIVRIENTGTGDADGVRATIQTSINGTKEAFIGKIEPDSDAPAVFYLQNPPAGDIGIPISVTEKEKKGDELNDSVSITVTSKGSLPIFPIIILIIVGIGAFLIYQKRVEKR
jgi:hypothetical protein